MNMQEAIDGRVKAMLAAGIKLCYPEQFSDLGDRGEVFAALMATRSLTALAQLRSSTTHLCWEGTAEMFAKLAPFECQECEEHTEEDLGDQVNWLFEIGA